MYKNSFFFNTNKHPKRKVMTLSRDPLGELIYRHKLQIL